MLAGPMVGPRAQNVILDYMMRRVLGLCATTLPPGDPLNDPVFLDLFWDWVGSSPRPDSNRYFSLKAWCEERWTPVQPGGNVPTTNAGPLPRWRVVS